MQLVHVLTQYSKLHEPFFYYHEGNDIKAGMRVLVIFNNREIIGYVVSVEHTEKALSTLEEELGIKLLAIAQVIDLNPILTDELIELSDNLASYYFASKISVLQAMLPPSLKPSKSSLKAPKISYNTYVKVNKDSKERLNKAQTELVDLVAAAGRLLVDTNNRGRIKTLVNKGVLILESEEKFRYNFENFADEEVKSLSKGQQEAIDTFFANDQETFLLEGVTGSGKTEVYLTIAEDYISRGQNVIMLVPEIGLTGMMLAKFRRRFGDKIAIFHSELTPAEKYDEYRRIKDGHVNIVVGARSAVFAPLSNIGLFILDEEHAETYKQDVEPSYHALTVAQMRAKSFNSRILLGSATPNIETKARANKGNYGYYYLGERFNKKELPSTILVNMLDLQNISKASPFISKALEKAISETLERKEQIILLVNRRGYAPSVSCRSCGAIKRCNVCGLPLVYHKNENIFKCHSCGLTFPYTKTCDICNENNLRFSGYGTQKAEEDISRMFPHSRILRLDSDTSKERLNTLKILTSFAERKADILIGTQMVAKGHDFPGVTLVGVLGVDSGLALPLFRASERVFQLVTQAIGRAGRDVSKGRAIIQTTIMDHYALLFAQEQNYEKFYQKEMQMRKFSHNPPYYYLMSLTLMHKDEIKLLETLNTLRLQLVKAIGEDAEVIGPIPHLYVPIKDMHEAHLLIKYKNYFKIKPFLLKTLRPLQSNNVFNVKINVDPYNV